MIRNLLISAILLLSTLLVIAQDIPPTPAITFKKLQAPNNPIFWYNQLDSALWVFKGETGWLRIAGNSQLVKYYVPYNNALYNVNLGDKRISSTKQRLPLFNGACQVSTIVDNGDGSITVGDGEYHLSTNVEGRGTENFVITGGTFTLTNNTTNYLVADYNYGTPILRVITDVNLINETTIVPVFTAYRSGNFLHFQNWDSLGVALANKIHQSIVKTQRYRRESGLALAEYPSRYLSLSSGKVWVGAVPVSVDAIATSTDNMYIFHHSGGVWTMTVSQQYNNSQYDDGTSLVTLTPNRYAVNWIYRGIESQKHMYVTLGTGDYTLAQAQEAKVPNAPVQITSHAMLVGKIIVQNGTNTSTSIQSVFDPQFTASAEGASVHNDLTGRDVLDSHPAGAVSSTPSGTLTATTVADALIQLDNKKEPNLIKGNLVENAVGLEFSDTRQVIGGTTTLTLSSGYSIPTDINIQHGEAAYTHSQNDNDTIATNELNTSMDFNYSNKRLTVYDGEGNSVSTTINITGGNVVNSYLDKADITTSTISVTFPDDMNHINYFLSLRTWYDVVYEGKTISVNHAISNTTKTVSGFTFSVDTVAGYYEYLAVDTTNLYPITFENFIPSDSLITAIRTPGADTRIPTEKAVRDALSSVVVDETDPIYSASSWPGTTNNSTNWNAAYNKRIASLGFTSTIFTVTSADASTATVTVPTFNQNTTGTASNVTGIITGANGGTGVANTDKTITIGGNLVTIGGYTTTLTVTDNTSITLPTSGTLMANLVEDTTPQLGGDLDLNSKNIVFQTSFSNDHSYSGEVQVGTAGENLVFGDLVYFKFSDLKWWKASASAYATARCAGVAVATINANSTGYILLNGMVRDDTWDWTAAEVWLSTTAGSGTSTQPSTTGNQIQFVGRAMGADLMFFKPSNDIGEK